MTHQLGEWHDIVVPLPLPTDFSAASVAVSIAAALETEVATYTHSVLDAQDRPVRVQAFSFREGQFHGLTDLSSDIFHPVIRSAISRVRVEPYPGRAWPIVHVAIDTNRVRVYSRSDFEIGAAIPKIAILRAILRRFGYPALPEVTGDWTADGLWRIKMGSVIEITIDVTSTNNPGPLCVRL